MRYTFDSFEIDMQLYELHHNGQLCKLEPQEFNVLAYLIEHRNQIVTKDELLEHVWPDQFVSESTLSSRIKTLRRALGDSGRQQRYVKTIHGRGYRFVAALKLVTPDLISDLPHEARSPADQPSVSPPPLDSSISPEVASGTTGAQTSLAPAAQPAAERRQLTILFCDLVGSTLLSDQLDPEDLDDILQAYYAACDEAIKSFGGHVAQYLGDGLLVYFGYPHAQEDAARRAAHTGLDVLRTISALNHRLETDYGVRLDVRIGIHTGLVIVGEGRSEGRAEHLAVGATPNIASRIQSLSAPNTILVSEATQALISGYFELDEMGPHELQGVAEPMQLYHVIAASETQHRLDVGGANRLPPFVGRDLERMALQYHWEQVKQGQGHVVVVSGEAGIGKSRLARTLIEGMSGEPHLLLEGHCSPYHQHTAFHPLAHLLRKHLDLDVPAASVDPIAMLARFAHDCQLDEDQTVPALATLLGLPYSRDQYPELALTPAQQRQFIFETLLNLVLSLAKDQPLLFFIEDGHWLDPSTLEWLHLLVDQGPTASILTLITTRPEFIVPWQGRAHVTTLTLNQLSAAHITEIVQSIAGAATVASEFLERIVNTTDGVPLFAEEITRLIVESGLADRLDVDSVPQSSGTGIEIPATLQDLLISRLDALGAAKRTAQVAATIGREFSFELLQAVSPLDDASLRHDLETLLTSDLLYQRRLGQRTAYQFKHALIQEAAYSSQLRRARQQQHQQIADALAASVHDAQDVDLEVVAYHYTKAGDTAEAVSSWLRAGEQAAKYSAHLEAVAHLRQGIELLHQLPASPARNRLELEFYVTLGSSLYTLKGFADPEVEDIHLHARTLCQELGDIEHLLTVLRGLVIFYVNRGPLKTAELIAAELLEFAETQRAPEPRMLGHYSLTIALFARGKFKEAIRHGEQVLALYKSPDHDDLAHHYGIDVRTGVRSFMALALWMTGYPDQALQSVQDAVHQAQQSSHAFSLVTAKTYLSWVYCLRQEPTATYDCATESHEVADERGFALYAAFNQVWQGWALTAQGPLQDGIELMRETMTAIQAMGTEVMVPYHLALIAEAVEKEGSRQEETELLAEALARVDGEEGYWWEAELHRLNGELLLRQSENFIAQANSCFTRALDIARAQQATSLELRAAMSLSQLWSKQGKCTEARELLAEVYCRFTEGFDTLDLVTAQNYLDELA